MYKRVLILLIFLPLLVGVGLKKFGAGADHTHDPSSIDLTANYPWTGLHSWSHPDPIWSVLDTTFNGEGEFRFQSFSGPDLQWSVWLDRSGTQEQWLNLDPNTNVLEFGNLTGTAFIDFHGNGGSLRWDATGVLSKDAGAQKFASDPTEITDLDGDGLTISANALEVYLNNTVDIGPPTNITTSGMRFVGGALQLLQGCDPNQVLKAFGTPGEAWQCADQAIRWDQIDNPTGDLTIAADSNLTTFTGVVGNASAVPYSFGVGGLITADAGIQGAVRISRLPSALGDMDYILEVANDSSSAGNDVTAGILITTETGSITQAIDVSDIGLGTIIETQNSSLGFAELDLLDGLTNPIVTDNTAVTSVDGDYLTINSGVLDVDIEAVTDTKCIAIEDPVDADDLLMYRFDAAGTMTSVDCITEDLTSAVVVIVECDSGGNNCGSTRFTESLDCVPGGDTDDGLAVTDIVAGAWIRAQVGTVVGTVNLVNACFTFTADDV